MSDRSLRNGGTKKEANKIVMKEIGKDIKKKPLLRKSYNRTIVNRWFVLITLINNNSLIFHRKESSSYRKLIIFHRPAIVVKK